jgi:hypothetical protein
MQQQKRQASFSFAVFDPRGLQVQGTHDTAPAAQRDSFRQRVFAQQQRWISKTLSLGLVDLTGSARS